MSLSYIYSQSPYIDKSSTKLDHNTLDLRQVMYNELIFHRPILFIPFNAPSTTAPLYDFLSFSILSQQHGLPITAASVLLTSPIDQKVSQSRRLAFDSVLFCIDSDVDIVAYVYPDSPFVFCNPLCRRCVCIVQREVNGEAGVPISKQVQIQNSSSKNN